MKAAFLILLTLSLLGSFTTSLAQEKTQSNLTGRINKLDTIAVTVFREPDLDSSGQLDQNGSLSIPLIGSVRLQGLTTTAAEQLIESKLKDGYLVRPQVTVRISQRVVKTVAVVGEARQAGVFTLPGDRPLTLTEVIAMAGGPTDIADKKKITIKRGSTGKIQVVNLKDILNGKAQDVILGSGDVINIPEGWF